MLLLIAFALGAFYGWRQAAARNGDRLDRLQWAAGCGIAATLVTLALSIAAARFGWI